MPKLADHVVSMPRSGIREVMDAAWRMQGEVIGLHVGEPSFPTPEHIREGARKALDAGATRYVPNAGIPELREAIAQKLHARNRLEVQPEQIVVSAGGMQALHNTLALMVSAGDEVLIPDPGWPNFAMVVQLLQGQPIRYQLRSENGFQPAVQDLEALVTDRTVAVLVNSPSNPLGTVLGRKDALDLLEFANRNDLWVVSDECYDGITFDQPHLSIGSLGGEAQVVSCFSFSKTYAMTGMRVGYSVLPMELAHNAAKVQEPLISCVNAPAQWAALAALAGPQDVAEEMRKTYQDRRDAAMSVLDQQKIGYLKPEGAFYLWVDVRDRCAGDVSAWALAFLEKRRVAVAPGTAFGPAGEGWARLSLATATPDLLEGCRRLGSFDA